MAPRGRKRGRGGNRSRARQTHQTNTDDESAQLNQQQELERHAYSVGIAAAKRRPYDGDIDFSQIVGRKALKTDEVEAEAVKMIQDSQEAGESLIIWDKRCNDEKFYVLSRTQTRWFICQKVVQKIEGMRKRRELVPLTREERLAMESNFASGLLSPDMTQHEAGRQADRKEFGDYCIGLMRMQDPDPPAPSSPEESEEE